MTNDLGAPAPSRGRLLAARAVAVVAALFWGVLFFGLVDLATVVLQDERFARHYLVEAGWGLLYTGLAMLPLLAWAVRPRATVLLQGVLVTGAAVALAGLVAGAFGQLLPALGLAASALVPAVLARQDLRPARVTPRAVHPALAGLALAGLGGAVAHAVAVLHAGGAARWRAGVVPPALVAVSLGACSVLYPEHLASLGTVGGVACAAWGAALGACGVLLPDTRVLGRAAPATPRR
ncbi:hypothetical protein L603_000300000160 [Cellulosimicrobium cellulans J34]|nr:hypothetical protein L603_000300000160 [Cellulosimicrobium cellulans J34]